MRLARPKRTEQVIPGVLLDAIRERAGLVAADHVVLGIRRAMARASLDDPVAYLRMIDRDPALFDSLLDELTVGETYFFREAGQFEFVRREVLPTLHRRLGPGQSPKAWSAACASGEEAYSLAILGYEYDQQRPLRVLATDVARARLATARAGVYGPWSLRGVPDETIGRYFTRAGRDVRVIDRIRSLVEFSYLNLAASDHSSSGVRPGGMDIIFCRNVLIYMDRPTMGRVAASLLHALAPEGWIFLGASDPPLSEFVSCDVIVTGSGLAYRRAGVARKATVASRGAFTSAPQPAAAPPAQPLPTPVALGSFQSPLEPPARAEPGSALSRSLDRAKPDAEALAAQCYRDGDYDAAVKHAERAVELHGDRAEAWVILVRSLANLGRTEEASVACAAGLDNNRTSPELTYLQAMLLRDAGRDDDAVKALRCAIYLDRQSVAAHMAMGDALLALGNDAEARRSFRNAGRLLEGMSDDVPVPGTDGVPAGRLRAAARARLGILERVSAG